MKKVLIGNHALSYGAKLARVNFISAYPITPQTEVVEYLSELCSEGELNARFVKVESEHSAMAACIGSESVGVRSFTATSSQGLALMHELLHWAAGARLPIVMGNVNRAMGPPWNIWTEQTDSLAQRDTGWLQIYASTNQEVLDSVILAYKIAEKIMLPVMVVLDAFVLSHTSEVVDIPAQELVDEFLPEYNPLVKMDVDDPHTFGGLGSPDIYMELRYKIEEAMESATDVIKEAGKDFEELFGRYYGLTECYKCDDAEYLIITSSTIAQTAILAVDELRKKGIKAGLLRVRVFRPFPSVEIADIVKGKKRAVVIDRNISFGKGGIFCDEIKGAIYNKDNMPEIVGYVAGLGGRDVSLNDVIAMFEEGISKNNIDSNIYWWGVKK